MENNQLSYSQSPEFRTCSWSTMRTAFLTDVFRGVSHFLLTSAEMVP